MRLIDADKLKEHKFLTPDAEEAKKWLPAETQGYQLGWNDAIDAIVDKAPTIETTIENLISTLSVEELKATTWFKVDTPSGEAISFRREKTGHWIKEDEQNLCGLYRCSECGRRVEDLTDDIKIHAGCEDYTIADIYPYCHCGSKMTGGKMDKSQITIDLINGIKENHKTAIEKCENDAQILNIHISEQNVLLMDIACSLALIADGFIKETEK